MVIRYILLKGSANLREMLKVNRGNILRKIQSSKKYVQRDEEEKEKEKHSKIEKEKGAARQ